MTGEGSNSSESGMESIEIHVCINKEANKGGNVGSGN